MKINKGFTLLEVLIVALITGIVGLGVVFSVARSNTLVNESVIFTMANVTMNQVLYDISRDVKEGVALEHITGEFNPLIIHYADGSTVEWQKNTDPYNWDYLMIRTSKSGGEKEYRIPIRRNVRFSDNWMKFWVNKDIHGNDVAGKYHMVTIQLVFEEWTSGEGLKSESIATYSCKHQASGYGF